MEVEKKSEANDLNDVLQLRIIELQEMANEQEDRKIRGRMAVAELLHSDDVVLPDWLVSKMQQYSRLSGAIRDEFREERQWKAKGQTIQNIGRIKGVDTGRTVTTWRDHGSDIGGGYESFMTWTFSQNDAVTVVEETSRRVGWTSTKGNFDDISHKTHFVSETLTVPLVADKALSEIISHDGTLRTSDLQIGSWDYLGLMAEKMSRKARADDAAQKCAQLLDSAGAVFVDLPGSWGGQARSLEVTVGSVKQVKLRETRNKNGTEYMHDFIIGDKAPGEHEIMTRGIHLSSLSGCFDGMGASGSGDALDEQFADKLSLIELLRNI